MSFPDKQQREACWGSKDRYWECLDTQKGSEEMCKEFRKLYESSCPAQWVKHFDRKRNYLQFKERIEKDGYEPLEQLKS
ncbi:unnamed protein product [Nezara viridula]|uniref:Cytochrome c oxidase assembly factor 6 homolog n=1 Tax=Nezara viridula TaxID=85310 RepID=A0A9P0E929_NEZVI|nr:unnamed protein product [Nezara viridula]